MPRTHVSWWILLPGLAALTAEPLRWLVRTWTDPSYGSDGALVALLVAAIAARSLLSGPPQGRARPVQVAGLLAATLVPRLLGRALDVDHLGALALVVDVGAWATALGLHRRPWPVAPWALAGLAALALPVEQVLQQLVSYPLRLGAASTAALLLAPLGVVRQGTVLADASGTILEVDVACSGATGLVTLGVLAFAVATRRAPGARGLAVGALAVIGGAWIANTLRLVLLVLGPTTAWLEQPAHTIVGLVALTVGLLPALRVARSLPDRLPPAPEAAAPDPVHVGPRFAAVFTAAALAVAAVPAHPVDRSRPVTAHPLPAVLDAWPSETLPPTPLEADYVARYGGTVERRRYDTGAPHTVLVSRTTAPLRHLHNPALCLAGSGHAVERLGRRAEAPLPTVVWRTVGPDGVVWRVETTFVSDAGASADSASEVAWRWLADPGATWTLVERVTPWDACEADPAVCDRFDEALAAAFAG